MHHWRDAKTVFRQIYRVLLPGGVAFISDLRSDAPEHIVKEVAGLLNENQAKGFINSVQASYLPSELKAMLKELGIKNFSVTDQEFSRKTIAKNLDLIRSSPNRSQEYNKLYLNVVIRKF